jgi:hypothetical protein
MTTIDDSSVSCIGLAELGSFMCCGHKIPVRLPTLYGDYPKMLAVCLLA